MLAVLYNLAGLISKKTSSYKNVSIGFLDSSGLINLLIKYREKVVLSLAAYLSISCYGAQAEVNT